MRKIFYAACHFAGLAMTGCGSDKPKAHDNEGNAVAKCETNDKHNAENSIDYQGTYKGTLPAADGPGINMALTINNDSTYTLEYDYIERDGKFKEQGNYTVEGNLMTLTEKEGQMSYFKVEEGQLRQLDNDKQPITGELEAMYILKKQ